MEKAFYHCSGCERLVHCETAFKLASEKCDLYVRSSFHNCQKCLRFGQDCRKSGLIKCEFLPRVSQDLVNSIIAMKGGTGNE